MGTQIGVSGHDSGVSGSGRDAGGLGGGIVVSRRDSGGLGGIVAARCDSVGLGGIVAARHDSTGLRWRIEGLGRVGAFVGRLLAGTLGSNGCKAFLLLYLVL